MQHTAGCPIDGEEQISSYNSQLQYYRDYISKNPEWTMVGIYADKAITGIKADARPDFVRMVNDCFNDEIDMIVTMPFNFINEVGDKVGDKTLNDFQTKALAEIRNNPNITKPQLMIVCNLGKTSIDNIVSVLKKKGYIERVRSNKSGYWKAN